MKQLGYTETNGLIVEMSDAEFKAFQRLAAAVEGKTIFEIRVTGDRDIAAVDLSTVFGAIEQFTITAMVANELTNLSVKLQDALHGRGKGRSNGQN